LCEDTVKPSFEWPWQLLELSLLLLKRKFCSRVSRMELLSLVRLQLLLLFPGAEEAVVVIGCWSLRLLLWVSSRRLF